MTTIPNDLAEDLLLFLQKHALSPQSHASEAEALMVRLESHVEKALATAATSEPPDPLAAFTDETARDLAGYIAKRTGLVPVLTTSYDPGTKHREPVTFNVLRFWMRDRDGMPVTRDLDLREYHPREGVKHALRAAARTAGLDHFGAPLASKPEGE